MLSGSSNPFDDGFDVEDQQQQQQQLPSGTGAATGGTRGGFDVDDLFDDHQPQQQPQPTAWHADPAAAPAAASATTTAAPTAIHKDDAEHQQQHPPTFASPARRERVMAFKVDQPEQQRTGLRTINYFTITVDVIAANDATYSEPTVAADAPYMRAVSRGIELGVKRNELSQGTHAVIQRRYAELVALRTLLCFQFRGLVIPPLPTKSKKEDVETHFAAEDAFRKQIGSISFFLNELACMPEIVFFSSFLEQFLTAPREQFELAVRPRIKAALGELQAANQFISKYSERSGSVVETSAAWLTETTTSVLRAIGGYLWNGGNGNSGEAEAAAGALQPARLPPSVLADMAEWKNIYTEVLRRSRALYRMRKTYEAYLHDQTTTAEATTAVSRALAGYKETAGEPEEPRQLCSDVVAMMGSCEEPQNEFKRGKYLNVVLRLRCECAFADAVLDAIDNVLSLYRLLADGSAHTADYDAILTYATSESEILRRHVDTVYLKYYRQRMLDLTRRYLVKSFVDVYGASAAAAQDSNFSRANQAGGGNEGDNE